DGPITPVLARTMSRPPPPALRRSWGLALGWSGSSRTQANSGYGKEQRERRAGGSDRRHLRDPLVQLLAHRLIGRGLHFAPVWKGGGDRGYSDLAVAAVEVRLTGGGIGLAGIVVLG